MCFDQKKMVSGVTLVEMMVVVAIIGIISAVAYPSYRNNVRGSDRVAARALLLENAQFMERFFTENNSYSQTAGASPTTPVLPNLVSPRDATGTRVKYNISFRAGANALSATTFALQAVPANAQSGDPCLTLTYNNLGQRGVDGTPTLPMTTEACWNQ